MTESAPGLTRLRRRRSWHDCVKARVTRSTSGLTQPSQCQSWLRQHPNRMSVNNRTCIARLYYICCYFAQCRRGLLASSFQRPLLPREKQGLQSYWVTHDIPRMCLVPYALKNIHNWERFCVLRKSVSWRAWASCAESKKLHTFKPTLCMQHTVPKVAAAVAVSIALHAQVSRSKV